VRWYLQKPVPRELIDKALDVGLQAPSACNRQPFEVRILDDPALVREIAALPMGTVGLHHNFPTILVWVGRLRSFAHHRDRHVPYIDAAMAAMGFQLALETLGLSSCCLNWRRPPPGPAPGPVATVRGAALRRGRWFPEPEAPRDLEGFSRCLF
jgi:nitroreductase